MNIYFLVEGKRTEAKVYPEWLSHLLPDLVRVQAPGEVNQKNYFLISGGGFPSLLDNHLRNSIEDVNSSGNYNYLVVCLDADEQTIPERVQEVNNFILREELKLKNCQLEIIVQNRCIETWFLGNKRAYPRHPVDREFIEYSGFYDVSLEDPELMGIFRDFNNHAQFHHQYLKKMLLEKNIRYTKVNPRGVVEPNYLNQLISRTEQTRHLGSLKTFLDFCKLIDEKLKQIKYPPNTIAKT